jgi:serine/threonine protein kinase/Tol biopolymer transport system component
VGDEADALIALATAISDGAPVAWPSERSSDISDADREVLRHLRVIADIVSLQRRHASQAADTSVVDELRQAAPRPPDARDALPSWGPLRLIGLVGHGAFGEVYRAWDSRLDREVALKLLRRRDSRCSAGSALVDEGRLLAKVRHPHVITVYGAERIGDHVGLWMEFIEGPTLAQLIASNGPLAGGEVVRIGRELCGALAAVHGAGLLHRDIKAQNVMRDSDGRVVLMDFGSGREAQVAASAPHEMAGTPLYLAPEIFDGAGASERSDIYSLGVLLYHLATGAYPVSASTILAIRDGHRSGQRRTLAEARPDLPRGLAGVIDRALSAEPAERFDSAASFEAALAGLGPRAEARVSRTRLIAVSLAAAAALMAGVVYLQRTLAARGPNGMVIRRIAAEAPVDGTSGVSSDGRYLSHPDSNSADNLALTDLSTGKTRALTRHASPVKSGGQAESSAFSPDDSLIAYVWLTAAGGYELRVVGVDGSRDRVLYHDDQTVHIPAVEWSPDGTSLLLIVRRSDGTCQMALVPIADGAPRVLKTFGLRSPGMPRFSPDGRFVAYDLPQQDGAPARDIFALAVKGGDAPLVQHPADDFVLGWTPDGRRLLFGSDRSGTTGAWFVPVADGRPAAAPDLFRPDLGSGWPLRVTPSGSYYYGVPVNTNDIYTATLDAAMSTILEPPAQTVQRAAGTNKWPEWSPDGRQLAYVSQFRVGTGGEGRLTLVIESLDGGARRELTPPLTFFSRLRWAPDGRSFLANARDENNRGGLYRIDVRSGESTLLVRSQGLTRQSAWFRDGRAILYWDPAAGPRAPIVKRDLQSGAEAAVHRGGDFALSPDNRWLIAAEERPQNASSVLTLVPLSGGVGRDLMDGGPGAFNLGCSWAPDSRCGLCIKAQQGRPTELWRFSIDGSAPQRLLVMAGMAEVRVNADGRRIAFSVHKGVSELWVMENFLPVPVSSKR